MSTEISLPPQTVQETMLLPLWGRGNYSKLYPELLDDPLAQEIIKNVSYDFSRIEKSMGEYGGLAYLVRSKRFDTAINAYLCEYPQATVVNLGSGLDTTFSRVDNGLILWYNLDMPDALAFRKQFIPERARCTSIACSAFDHAWFDQVDFDPDRGIFILASGLLMYFEESQVRELFIALAERFPGGAMIYDGLSKFGRAYINNMLKITGAPRMHFALNDPCREIEAWSPKLRVDEVQDFWQGINRDQRWGFSTKMKMNFGDWLGTGKFIKVQFLSAPVNGEIV